MLVLECAVEAGKVEPTYRNVSVPVRTVIYSFKLEEVQSNQSNPRWLADWFPQGLVPYWGLSLITSDVAFSKDGSQLALVRDDTYC